MIGGPVFSVLCQNKLVVTYVQTGSTANSVTFNIMVSKEDNIGTSSDYRLGALTTTFDYTSGAMSNNSNQGATFSFGSSFPGYTFPVNLGFNTSTLKVRATMSTINAAASSVQLTTTPAIFATMTITSLTPIDFGPHLLPSTLGNPTLQASVYLDGSSTSTSRSLFDGTIITETQFDIQAPLPIEISDIKAYETEKSNKVDWTTASESNNDVQIVEKSVNGQDRWRAFAKVKSKNNSNGASYQVTDENPFALTYYRIKSVDFDGYTEYSKVVKVDRLKILNGFVTIYPNPSTDRINVDLSGMDLDNGEIVLSVFDMKGQQMIRKNIIGNGLELIDVNQLPAATYNVVVQQKDKVFQQRIIKID